MVNAFQTESVERSPSGSINKKHIHTPSAQDILMSLEDLLFMTLTISGMFHKGKITAAIKAIVCIIPSTISIALHGMLLYIPRNTHPRREERVLRQYLT